MPRRILSKCARLLLGGRMFLGVGLLPHLGQTNLLTISPDRCERALRELKDWPALLVERPEETSALPVRNLNLLLRRAERRRRRRGIEDALEKDLTVTRKSPTRRRRSPIDMARTRMRVKEVHCERSSTRRRPQFLVYQLWSWKEDTRRRRRNEKAVAPPVRAEIVVAPRLHRALGSFFILPPSRGAWNASGACIRRTRAAWPL